MDMNTGGAARASQVQQQPKKEVTLTETEIMTYGNRCPRGYQKLRILGK